MFTSFVASKNQYIASFSGIRLTIKREDQIHAEVSGNKFRKLKYNFLELQAHPNPLVITFGGAFSNHLAAVAAAGAALNIPVVGLVRGEEWAQQWQQSPTLVFCRDKGMPLHFLSREQYRNKSIPAVWVDTPHTLLPEGGTNRLAIQGCSEILTSDDAAYDTVCSCVGTGGTLAGLIKGSQPQQNLLGFPALQHPHLENAIQKWTDKTNWQLVPGYTFGGYAKANDDLVAFMNNFYKKYQIPLDPIYTGKMLFGIFDLIKNDQWQWGKNVLIIHSGGLQGIVGFNQRRKTKGLLLLDYA
ncbi:MAG: 1-aminocyclopropane-1-carboxylate deaminase/D-cysteine desulfhydrase [Flavobacteriaceae bacterium]